MLRVVVSLAGVHGLPTGARTNRRTKKKKKPEENDVGADLGLGSDWAARRPAPQDSGSGLASDERLRCCACATTTTTATTTTSSLFGSSGNDKVRASGRLSRAEKSAPESDSGAAKAWSTSIFPVAENGNAELCCRGKCGSKSNVGEVSAPLLSAFELAIEVEVWDSTMVRRTMLGTATVPVVPKRVPFREFLRVRLVDVDWTPPLTSPIRSPLVLVVLDTYLAPEDFSGPVPGLTRYGVDFVRRLEALIERERASAERQRLEQAEKEQKQGGEFESTPVSGNGDSQMDTASRARPPLATRASEVLTRLNLSSSVSPGDEDDIVEREAVNDSAGYLDDDEIGERITAIASAGYLYGEADEELSAAIDGYDSGYEDTPGSNTYVDQGGPENSPASPSYGNAEAPAHTGAATRPSFIERFIQITELREFYRGKSVSFASKMAMSEALYSLFLDFEETVLLYGRIICSERDLPVEEKSIRPATLGGFAGGEKFLVHGILFKFCTADSGLYASLDHANKVAGHDLRALAFIHNHHMSQIQMPLGAIFDYDGVRLVAVSMLPISSKTIVYGSADGLLLFVCVCFI
jgi:Clustered mitochondria